MTDLNFKRVRRLVAVSLGLSALLLTGCAGPSALRSSYIEYSHAQAQVNNQQTLLNLARVRNGHPPYFLQLGTMTANFSFTRGINGSYNRIDTPMMGLASTVSQMLALSGSATEAPMFSYAPLGGPNFSAVLMRPVDGRVFNGLAVQGFPLTVLLRMLTDTAQLSAAGGSARELHNYLDPQAPENYADFLRLVSVLQTLQQSRLLTYAVDATGSVLRIGTDARAAPLLARLAQDPRNTLKGATLAAGMSVDIRSRTFAGVLYAMAFDGVQADALPEVIKATIPADQVDAILRIDADARMSEPEATSLEYAGRRYVVSDQAGQMRYRSTFQGLQFVFSQIQLNPDQLPQAQVIQTR